MSPPLDKEITADLPSKPQPPVGARQLVRVFTVQGVTIPAGTYQFGPAGEVFETLADASYPPHQPKARFVWWLRRHLWGSRFLVTPVAHPDRVPARRLADPIETC